MAVAAHAASPGVDAAVHGRRHRPGEGPVRPFDDTLARLLAAAANDARVRDLGILGPALVAGLLVTATHVPLGMQVLKRGIVFIDLAIAQIAGLGVIVADALGFEPQGCRGAGRGARCGARAARCC